MSMLRISRGGTYHSTLFLKSAFAVILAASERALILKYCARIVLGKVLGSYTVQSAVHNSGYGISGRDGMWIGKPTVGAEPDVFLFHKGREDQRYRCGWSQLAGSLFLLLFFYRQM